MTADAHAVEAAPRSASFLERLRPRRAHVVAGLGLGLLFEWLVDGVPAGLGVSLLAVLTALAIASAGGREGWQAAKGHRWLLGVAVLLFGCAALQDAGWLTALDLLTGGVFAALALHGWTGESPLARLSPWRLFGAPFAVAGRALQAGAVVTGREANHALKGTRVSEKVPGALRLIAVVVPPVLVVTALLASGDVHFGARVDALASRLLEVPLSDFVRGGVVAAIAGVVLVGVIALATRRRALSTQVAEPHRFLTPVEACALLATLSAVLFAFGATTWDCALAPDVCALPPGVTYSEAANDGFFQLLAAALVILVLLMALPTRTTLVTDGQRRAFRALATALVAGTLPMVLSAVARLARYEDVYGLTRLRLMAHAGLFLVAAVMAWRAVTLWVAPERFVPGALALWATSLLALTALRPDELIARHNLRDRMTVDTYYLLTLSDDAAPAIVEALPHLSDLQQIDLRLHVRERRDARARTFSPGGWNLGQWRADRAVARLDEADAVECASVSATSP
ncbi:MAG: DUF4173 domain-containing protein [Myxococcota bacterium]